MNLTILQTLQKTQGPQGLEGLCEKNHIKPICNTNKLNNFVGNPLGGIAGREGLLNSAAPLAPGAPQRKSQDITTNYENKLNIINCLYYCAPGAPGAPSAPVNQITIEKQTILKELLTKIGLYYGANHEEIEEEFRDVLQNYSLDECLVTYRRLEQSLTINN